MRSRQSPRVNVCWFTRMQSCQEPQCLRLTAMAMPLFCHGMHADKNVKRSLLPLHRRSIVWDLSPTESSHRVMFNPSPHSALYTHPTSLFSCIKWACFLIQVHKVTGLSFWATGGVSSKGQTAYQTVGSQHVCLSSCHFFIAYQPCQLSL